MINTVWLGSMFNLIRACADLLWSFFPIFVVVLALSLFGKADELATRSDLVLSAAVLFAEGWWKSRSLRFPMRGAANEVLGFVGALVGIFLAAVMLLTEIGGISELVRVTSTPLFNNLKLGLEVASVLYAVRVRYGMFAQEDWQNGFERERSAKLKYLTSVAPEFSALYDAHQNALADDPLETALAQMRQDRAEAAGSQATPAEEPSAAKM